MESWCCICGKVTDDGLDYCKICQDILDSYEGEEEENNE